MWLDWKNREIEDVDGQKWVDFAGQSSERDIKEWTKR